MRGDINTPVADDPAPCQNAGLLSNALEVGKRLFVDDRWPAAPCLHPDVSSGSFASVWRPAFDFQFVPGNGHGTGTQDGSVPCPWTHTETPATSESAPFERSTKSQAVAYSRVTACDRLRLHSATAKQYCPSSSAGARHLRQSTLMARGNNRFYAATAQCHHEQAASVNQVAGRAS